MIDTNSSCREFMEGIASRTPVPGGGSVSALVGAFGAALGNMVAAYTMGKKKYESVRDEMRQYIDELDDIQVRLIELVQGDMDAFQPLAALYGAKAKDPEEKAIIHEKKQKALYNACMVPVEIIEQCGQAVEIMEVIAEKGNKLVVSDAAAGVVICKAAIDAACISVYINTKSFEDQELANKINQECQMKTLKYSKIADKVYRDVTEKLLQR